MSPTVTVSFHSRVDDLWSPFPEPQAPVLSLPMSYFGGSIWQVVARHWGMVSVEEMEAVTFTVLLDSLRAPQRPSLSYSLDLAALPCSVLNLNSGFVPRPHLLVCHYFVKILNVTVFPNYSSFPSILIVTTFLSCMGYYRYFLTHQCRNPANTSLSNFFWKLQGFTSS